MKILWLSHLIPYPPKGGVLQRAHHMVRELAKRNQVDLLAFNQESLIAPMFRSVKDGLDEARKELGSICRYVEFVPIHSTDGPFGQYGLALHSLFTKDPYTIRWLNSRQYGTAVEKLVKSTKYDLVHFDTVSLVRYKRMVGKTPTVLDHHNVESHMMLRRAQNETNALKKWYFKQEGKRLERIEREFCPQFSLNVMCSQIDKNRLHKITPTSRIEVIPNGVDTDFFCPHAVQDHQRSIIFVGTLNWYPNIEAVRFIAFKIWPKLKVEVPGISVDIIGAHPPDDIRSIAAADKRFNVHGFVDDIRSNFEQAAVYVCPIRDGGGTKLKILDALAMQKAIVAHPIACEGIDVTDGKDVAFAEEPDDYVDLIKRLIDDNEARKNLGRNARKLAENHYSYKKIGESMSDLYAEIAGISTHNSV